MIGKVFTASLNGYSSNLISVEVDIRSGLPSFNIVGLAATSIKESKERVKSALINSGYKIPISKITVNLSPADIKKEGSLFDLPIALAILVATNQLNGDFFKDYIVIGELSLFGDINKIRGALPIILDGLDNNINNFIIPSLNKDECALVKKANIFPFSHLNEVVHYIHYKDLLPYKLTLKNNSLQESNIDFAEISGQESCKRALEVAASGGHNIIMFGPPGCGKTMLAERIPTILPSLNYEEALEVTKIYSVAGKLDKNFLIKQRPFRSPHSTSSKIALVGGGSSLTPGEISLAHNGVLFLDEILEFKKNVIEVLRQPLEDRCIKITRYNGNVTYPCNFMLVSSLNPCPCGMYGTSDCTCSEYEIKRYINKLSKPILDRIDIFTFVAQLSFDEVKKFSKSESSKTIKERVVKAREIQLERFSKDSIYTNSQMKRKQLKKYCDLTSSGSKILRKIYTKFNLSARAYCRILKVSRTIADLNGNEKIKDEDIIEALQYRKFIDNKIL
ncbi:ATP-binding protein [Clostridium niameyense]|uniref:ATP-binding protein n=1 Tax=Clostridium niameyense TaxID=1622073 RepID=A0A6M0R8R2_9CLOT|nr:YifB family Mg chelatase-like AAA ATPase [Clostridium niameyense]NEZ46070.1 ATP-binding protein [Clostridium niameyense]